MNFKTIPFTSKTISWVFLFFVLLLASPLWNIKAAPVVPVYNCTEQSQIPERECDALVAIFDANPDGIFSEFSSGEWLNGAPCNWHGVHCDENHVYYLDLSFNNLAILPPEIGDFSNLVFLTLSNNELKDLPSEISNLNKLSILELSGNQLSRLPEEIQYLSQLRELTLNRNPLTGELPIFLTMLFLNKFWFYDTEWCVPNDTVIQQWLEGIMAMSGTGHLCGNHTITEISGKVLLEGMSPSRNTMVGLYRSYFEIDLFEYTAYKEWYLVDRTRTNTKGIYAFSDLEPEGDYKIQFFPPNQFFATRHSSLITLVPDSMMHIDAVLPLSTPPLATITTPNGSIVVEPNSGKTSVSMRIDAVSDMNVIYTAFCPDDAHPTEVILVLNHNNDKHFPMIATENPNEYKITIFAEDIVDGTITVHTRCTPLSSVVIHYIGSVDLYNPWGQIINVKTGEPIAGAEISYFYVPGWEVRRSQWHPKNDTCESVLSKDENSPWSQSAPTSIGFPLNQSYDSYSTRTNIQKTDNSGFFGINNYMPTSCLYVLVEAEGYLPLYSPVFGHFNWHEYNSNPDLNLKMLSLKDSEHLFLPTVLNQVDQ